MQTMSHGRTADQQKGPYRRFAVWTTAWSNAGVNSFSGAMAGVASGIVTCPLDVIKTKLQAQGAFQALEPGTKSRVMYHGLLGTARTIVKEDGVRGLYRGLGPMLLGYLPTWAVYMTVYDGSREWFYQHGYSEGDTNKLVARIYASVTAGACSTIATNPIWVIKTRLMSQVSKTATGQIRTPWYYDNTLDAARKMWQSEGIRAFYSGLAPALLGLTHVTLQFPLYEALKQRFTGVGMGEVPSSSSTTGSNTLGILAATFFSKIVATTATYPHEVLRTRLQTQQRVTGGHHNGPSSLQHSAPSAFKPHYEGVINTFQIILKEEGWRAFYNGMGTNMIRAVPAAMTTMLTFESVKSAIGKMQEEGRELKQADTIG